MDVLDEELIKFWRALNENNVRYIMVGGFATRFHGFNRNTDDLDMWLEDMLENRKNLRAAIRMLGYGDFAPLETMPFVPGFSSINIVGGIELDIMTQMKGLEDHSFEECLSMASIADLEGVHVPTRIRAHRVLSYGCVRVFRGEDLGLLARTFRGRLIS